MPESKKSPQPPPPKSSGEHPAVKSYRAKMESIVDGETTSNLADLDAALEQFLKESSEPPPDTLPEGIPPVCEVYPLSSAMCALGTKGCARRHEE